MDVAKQNVANIYPLTSLQEGFLFHALANMDDSYIQQIVYVLKGQFDEARFTQVWQQLIDRHDILRTAFIHTGADRPLQLVLKKRKPVLETFDLRHSDADGQNKRRQQLKLRDRRRGFQLDKDCLMRFTLLYLSDDLTEVIWSHHHIILDGWSLGILLNEYTTLYENPLADLPYSPPFAGYVKWLEQKDRQKSRAYWRQYLDDYQNEIKLPFTLPYPASDNQRVRAAFELPKDLVDGIQHLSRQLQVSLNSILQGVWAILLAKYNDCDDVVFAVAVSGRPGEIEHVEQMVGLFINTIPVRIKLTPELTIAELFAQIQTQSLQSEQHHYSPLQTIQNEHPLKNRLLSTHLTFENFPLDERFKQMTEADADASGLQVQNAEVIERTHYPLDIQFLPSASGLKVQMAYSADYQPDMHLRIEQHLNYLLEQICQSVEARLSTVSLLTAAEKQVLIARSEAGVKVFVFESLLQSFNQVVTRQGDNTALVFEDKSMTYSELNHAANVLAQRLYQQGLQAGDFVGLCFDRSMHPVVAILGVLKGGMVYVPMDPSLPIERMKFMAQDSGIKLLLSDEANQARIQQFTVTSLLLDLNEMSMAAEPTSLQQWSAQPESPAYVIYTSGSTGQPKGVLVSHGNMARLFSAADQLFDFNADDTWCLFHSFGFDFSVWEIWGALRYGAKLVIVPYWLARSPADFHHLLQAEKVSVLNQTPTAFNQLIEHDQQSTAKLDALRYVIFGGEKLDFRCLAPWFKAYSAQPQLINMYGITETTVHVTFKKITPELAQWHCSNIGQALPDLQVYVLDHLGQLCAPGVPGELYVGGAGVCLGYLNRAELTAERFVHLPQIHAGERLFYRTGDAGRVLDNGDLEYLGRLDQQVQFHGYRIELGEIEQAFMRVAGVDQVVVLVKQDAEGEQTIIAFYTGQSSQAIESSNLREQLSQSLPAYMIPGQLRHIEQFPLTANGKVDKNALTELPLSEQKNYQPATNTAEQILVQIWANLLPAEQVGIHDDFFALGGDSIQAIRVVSALRKQGFAIEVQDIFRYPTVYQLAPWLTKVEQSKERNQIVGEIPLTPVQHWFFQHNGEYSHHFNHSALLEASSGRWQALWVEQAWNQLLQHNDALRCSFKQNEQTVQAVILSAQDVSLKVQTLSLMAEDDVEQAMVQYADKIQAGFDLNKPPLVALVIFQCPTGDRLLIVIHHLLVDGVSWRILLEDFSELYQGMETGQACTLTHISDGYADWAQGLADYSKSRQLLTELPYWNDVISKAEPQPWTEHSCLYQQAKTIQHTFDRELTQQLLEQANSRFSTTTEELLLAALVPTLHAWRGIQSSLLLLEGHGREAVVQGVEISRTIGWFTALYPFALQNIVGRDLGYQIKAVKENLRNVPGKGIGYGILQYLTEAKLRAGQSLAFQPCLVFNYLGRFDDQDQSGIYRVLKNDVGLAVSSQARRPAALEYSAMFLGDQLLIDWRYDTQCFDQTEIEKLATLYQQNLQLVIELCTAGEKKEITPSDLTYNDLTLDELDDIFS